MSAPSAQATQPAVARRGRVPAWIAVVAVIVGVVVAPPWRSPGIPAGFAARLTAGDLQRLVDARWVDVRLEELVPDGATVRSQDGARLAVDGGNIALSGEARARLADPLEITAGSVLTEVPGRERAVAFSPFTVRGRGSWRVDTGGAVRVGVYDGAVGIRADAAGVDCDGPCVAVGRLQDATVVGGRLPADPRPLHYEPVDEWDRRLLADVLAIDRQVAQLAAGFAARYGTAPQPPAFYTSFSQVQEPLADALPRLATTTVQGRFGPPADVLVAVVVTDLLVQRAGLGLDEAVDTIVRLRHDGATWGIVLAMHGLGPDALRQAATLAVRIGPAVPAVVGGAPGADVVAAEPVVPG
ncbi:MAG: hypothetical protein M3N57_07260, partial [Actinomycetota bacterium]|nr:hypothetical protein [Actinomycetota bacterium]